MLDYIRMGLYALTVVIAFLLFQLWQKEHAQVVTPTVIPVQNVPSNHFIPQAATSPAPTQTVQEPEKVNNIVTTAPAVTDQLVTVTTDVLEIKIDTRGGDIVESRLFDYPESLGSKTPYVLMNDNTKTRYIAESGLVSKRGPDTSEGQAHYTTLQTTYTLMPGKNELMVNLTWQQEGLNITKTFTFVRGSYEVKVGYNVNNQSTQPWQGNLYTQLMRTNTPPESKSGIVNLATYFGAAISSPKKPFDKITFKQMQEKPLDLQINDGWIAMIQHYFISAWVPPKNAVSNYYSKSSPDGLYTIGMIGQDLTAMPGTTVSTEAKLYTGPAIADKLEKTAPGLKLTIDYGWFWFISDIIFWMIQKIYDVVGNWGWSIVLVTIVIKLLFYKLSAKSYRSMSTLKRLQPKIEKLKERFGDDKQKLTQATLDLYRQEKVNPMSGCLPILIQIPVFIALYWVLVESVQLRQAPFILWIHDLSQQDPYYILPIMMGISMFIQQRLNPPPPDPLQAKVMMLMPLVFTFLFANFPAGLMLYWFVNNTLSFLQQWYIMHKLDKETNGRSKSL
jgi:YidC/Oxa1 family membrane protein insertase